MKKILSEYNDTLNMLNDRMKNIEAQVMERIPYAMDDSQNVAAQRYQIFRHENNDNLRLNELQNVHRNECVKHNEMIDQVNNIDRKINILQSYKEENELELRQSVDGLKYELRVVREELKTLEREKYSIANKLKSIEDKYNEAKESFKNAEEVLTYTNRMIVNNSKSRISADSEFMRYSNGRES
jgi:DNA repair exonuclease SbcCD ATPase subunit